MHELNLNLTRLNANFENMLKQDEIRDERIKNMVMKSTKSIQK